MSIPIQHDARVGSDEPVTRAPRGRAWEGRIPIRGLLLAVAGLSVVLIVVTALNYLTAVRMAEETLRNQGTSLGLELAATARARGAWEGPALQEVLGEFRRREVAFAVIADRDGRILAHSNPQLVGARLDDATFARVRDSGQLDGAFVTLGTGEETYQVTLPFHVPPGGPAMGAGGGAPRFRVLRLALHTAPARQIVYQAQAQVGLVAIVILALFAVSAWQVRTLRGYLALQRDAARQEHLAALGEMAAVLAHEIRNPLGAIKGLAQYLAEKTTGVPRQAEMTQTIATEATRLEGLVNDLLTYARPRPPERHSVDAGRVLAQVQVMAAPAAAAAGVSIAVEVQDGPLMLSADAEQMQQLVGNLALNGVQAMPGGGRLLLIAARATGGRQGAGAMELRVEDTGAGIPADHLPRVFEPFYTTRTKGTGLGLAICRRIAEAHGGTIRVDRTGPTGTAIVVTLPEDAER